MKGLKRFFLVSLTIFLIAGTILPSITSYAASKNYKMNYKKLKLNNKTLTLTKGEKVFIKFTNNTNQKLTWSSSKNSIATVNKSGKITAKANGKTTITVTAGNYKSTCKVKVKNLSVNSNKLKLKKQKLTLTKGKKYNLKVSVNKTKKNVTWSSSKSSVAAVNKYGKITAKSVGQTTITVKAGNYKATCEVTVKNATKATSKISTFENQIKSNVNTYEKLIKDVVKYTNQYRAANGKSKVSLDDTLTYVACYRSLEMANIDSLSHTRPNGTTVGSLAKAHSISYRILGENIGCYHPTAKAIVDGWYASPSHRENLLSNNYTKIGVGVAMTNDGYYYWTQLFIN